MKRGNNMSMIIMFAFYVILASSGLVLFKMGANNSNLQIQLFGFSINYSIKMIFGMMCYGVSFVLWMLIVSKSNLTIAMPLSVALVNTLVIIESCLLLKEKISVTQAIGILFIIVGVVIISLKK